MHESASSESSFCSVINQGQLLAQELGFWQLQECCREGCSAHMVAGDWDTCLRPEPAH